MTTDSQSLRIARTQETWVGTMRVGLVVVVAVVEAVVVAMANRSATPEMDHRAAALNRDAAMIEAVTEIKGEAAALAVGLHSSLPNSKGVAHAVNVAA